MKTATRTAPEIIAFVLGWDWEEVKANVYQPTVYRSPRIYVVGNDYVCCPTANQRPPKDQFGYWKWRKLGEAYGRTVYTTAPAEA